MDYFSIVNLKQEPFSNSPDPDFFFHSREHQECLQKLELSILLRRGLNVIIGDVGTGKTTLCRQLIRRFGKRDEITTHLILDPYFVDAHELLTAVGKMIMGPTAELGTNEWQIKEQIKQHLFNAGVKQDKTTVLIIDEGQKIPVFCLEVLREFLNYETNEFKLLQIVIFAQEEFEGTIKKYANFADRINLYHYLKPLNFRDTRLMIRYRLEKSKKTSQKIDIFSYGALLKIYRATGGYPRKIINLCHHCILAMIVQNRSKVGSALVRSCIKRAFPNEPRRWKGAAAIAGIAVFVALIVIAFQVPGQLKALLPQNILARLTEQPVIESDEITQDTDSETNNKENPEMAAVATDQTEADLTNENRASLEDIEPAVIDSPAAGDSSAQVATLNENPKDLNIADPVESPGEEQPEKESAGASLERMEVRQTRSGDAPYGRILGDITLKRDETLSRVIQTVYGSYNSKYFRSLILANPDIDDPDRVEVGQTIYLPAIQASVGPLNQNFWWVLIEEETSLEAAFDHLRGYPENAPPAHLIPYWSSRSGTRFAVVLKAYFYDRDSAVELLSHLPPGLALQGRVSNLWDEDTIFFSNPFSGGPNKSQKNVLKSEAAGRVPAIY
jgi:general secretion pathway protein A